LLVVVVVCYALLCLQLFSSCILGSIAAADCGLWQIQLLDVDLGIWAFLAYMWLWVVEVNSNAFKVKFSQLVYRLLGKCELFRLIFDSLG
jgi:hypothetical protein